MEKRELSEKAAAILKNSARAQKASRLFLNGYNCAQSVILAFEDMYDIDRKTILKLSSSFGGGMGRMREICGAVSAAFMVMGLLFGYDEAGDSEGKKELYRKIQELAGEFREANGSIVCRELLGIDKAPSGYVPDPRTSSYYAKRPCPEIIGITAGLLDEYISHLI